MALVLVAVVGAFAPCPPALVERVYSTNLYPRLQTFVTPLSNRVPFPLFDALIVLVLASWLLALAVDVQRARGGWARVATRLLMRTVVWSAALYLVFLAVWGLNYRRTKLTDKLRFDPDAISPTAALSLAKTTVERLNALYVRRPAPGTSRPEGINRSLAVAFGRTQRDLGIPEAAPGLPKLTSLDLYFRRAGVSGMTDPYFLETLVASDLLSFERPFVVAHEWAHLAGFADESEANFVGWLTSLRGSPADQYSAWLFLYGELASAVGARERGALGEQLGPGPRADLQAIARRREEEVNPRLAAAGWQVYDRYLKANRIEAGAASYADVVRLVLGVRFDPDWTPRLR